MGKAIINGQEIFGNVHLGEGGGITPASVLSNGVISTDSAYATASFSDISAYGFVIVRFRDTVNGVDYADYKTVRVSDIGGGLNFSITLHSSVNVNLTTTTVSAVNYSGAYYYMYADIIAFAEDLDDLFDGGN